MSFQQLWATIVKPDSPYKRELTHAVGITNAAAVFSEKDTTPRALLVKVDDSEPILLCRLRPDAASTFLQIQLPPGSSVTLSSTGGQIDVLGFMDLKFAQDNEDDEDDNEEFASDDFDSDEEDEEEEEEIAPPAKKQKSEQPKKTNTTEQPKKNASTEQPKKNTAAEQPKKNAEQPKKTNAEQPKKNTAAEQPKKTNAAPQTQLVNKTLSNGLKIQDIAVGSGKTVVKGKRVVIKYKGMLAKNNRKFDQSSNFAFTYGIGEVVRGMDLGLEGMKEGGKRRIVIPSALGYGKKGAGADIPPNADLIFDIELVRA